mgnify:CR=1 FL=1
MVSGWRAARRLIRFRDAAVEVAARNRAKTDHPRALWPLTVTPPVELPGAPTESM